ncbi:MAG: hypothetical protein NVSMB1_21720 [Polyangiales bacterium]
MTSTPTLIADDCPPSIILSETTDPPVGTIQQYDIKHATGPIYFAPTVTVHSCATGTAFEGRVFIDNDLWTPFFPVEPQNNTEVRTVHLTIPITGNVKFTKPRCHKIEYLVTEKFSLTDPRTSTKELTSIVWFIDVNEGIPNPTSSCNSTP